MTPFEEIVSVVQHKLTDAQSASVIVEGECDENQRHLDVEEQ